MLRCPVIWPGPDRLVRRGAGAGPAVTLGAGFRCHCRHPTFRLPCPSPRRRPASPPRRARPRPIPWRRTTRRGRRRDQQAALVQLVDDRVAGLRVDAHAHQHRALDARRRMRARQVDERIADLLDELPEDGLELSSLYSARCVRHARYSSARAMPVRPPSGRPASPRCRPRPCWCPPRGTRGRRPSANSPRRRS